MSTPDTEAARSARSLEPIGKAALIASVGGARGYADWTNPGHRVDPRHPAVDRFVTLRLISAIQESGKLVPCPDGQDPNAATGVGPNA